MKRPWGRREHSRIKKQQGAKERSRTEKRQEGRGGRPRSLEPASIMMRSQVHSIQRRKKGSPQDTRGAALVSTMPGHTLNRVGFSLSLVPAAELNLRESWLLISTVRLLLVPQSLCRGLVL